MNYDHVSLKKNCIVNYKKCNNRAFNNQGQGQGQRSSEREGESRKGRRKEGKRS